MGDVLTKTLPHRAETIALEIAIHLANCGVDQLVLRVMLLLLYPIVV